MANLKQVVTSTEDHGVDSTGAAVQRQTKEIDTQSSADAGTMAQNIVWYIAGFIDILLAFRFVLKLLGANSASSFVSFVYSVSGALSAPFDSIFGVTSTTAGTTRSVFEPSIIVAGIVYTLVAWGIVKLLTVSHKQ